MNTDTSSFEEPIVSEEHMEKTENTDFTVPGCCSSCQLLVLPQEDSSRAQSVYQTSTSTVTDNKMNTGPTLAKDCTVSEVYVEKPASTEYEGTFDFSLPGSAMSYIITSHRSPSTSPISRLSTAGDLVLSEEIDQLLSVYVPRDLVEMEMTSDVLPVLPDSKISLQNVKTAYNSIKEDRGDARPSTAQGSKLRKDTGSKRTSNPCNFFKRLTKKRSKISPDNAAGLSESDHAYSDDNNNNSSSNNTRFSWNSWRGRFTMAKFRSKLIDARNWLLKYDVVVQGFIAGGLFIAAVVVLCL